VTPTAGSARSIRTAGQLANDNRNSSTFAAGQQLHVPGGREEGGEMADAPPGTSAPSAAYGPTMRRMPTGASWKR